MTRVLTGGLLVGSAVLGIWVVTSLAGLPTRGEAPPAATSKVPSATATPARDDSQRRRDEVAMILARPVFSATRRPKEDVAGPATQAAPINALPRMSAIVINGKLRSAIFDANGRPTVLSEGGHLGPFTIQSIEPQQVTIIGPSGKRVVRTTFSNEPAPAIPAGLPQLQGLPPPATPVILPAGMPNLGPPQGAPR